LEPCHTLLLPPLENASTVVQIERTYYCTYYVQYEDIQNLLLETIPTVYAP
jgi:hypothetical protein